MLLIASTLTATAQTDPIRIDLTNTQNPDFVKGADVGFLSGQERQGVKFHDRNGQERECLELLKNDIRGRSE